MISPKPKNNFTKTLTSLITLSAIGAVSVGIALMNIARNTLNIIPSKNQMVEEAVRVGTEPYLAAEMAKDAAISAGSSLPPETIIYTTEVVKILPSWAWFLAGGILALIIVLVLNWRKI